MNLRGLLPLCTIIVPYFGYTVGYICDFFKYIYVIFVSFLFFFPGSFHAGGKVDFFPFVHNNESKPGMNPRKEEVAPWIPWTGPLHIIFPESNPYTLSGVPLFPVQLLEAAVLFLISFTLYLAYRQNRKHLFADYILLYAPSRFLIEFLRYDDAERGFWGILSTSQWVSILLFAAALLYLTIIYKEGDHYGSSIRRT